VTKKAKVIDAILSGNCNTSLDVADETGLTVKDCSVVIFNMIEAGVLRYNGRRMRGEYRNHLIKVFEVVA
jgi:predicted transcriptional regulator